MTDKNHAVNSSFLLWLVTILPIIKRLPCDYKSPKLSPTGSSQTDPAVSQQIYKLMASTDSLFACKDASRLDGREGGLGARNGASFVFEDDVDDNLHDAHKEDEDDGSEQLAQVGGPWTPLEGQILKELHNIEKDIQRNFY